MWCSIFKRKEWLDRHLTRGLTAPTAGRRLVTPRDITLRPSRPPHSLDLLCKMGQNRTRFETRTSLLYPQANHQTINLEHQHHQPAVLFDSKNIRELLLLMFSDGLRRLRSWENRGEEREIEPPFAVPMS